MVLVLGEIGKHMENDGEVRNSVFITRTHMHTQAHTCTCVYIFVYIYIHVCVCGCVFYIVIYIYTAFFDEEWDMMMS